MNTEKKCFKCGETKPLDEFYRHSKMTDGHLGKCKKCTKSDVSAHRSENLEKVREYDKERANLPHRVEARVLYANTEQGMSARRKANRNYFKTENGKKCRKKYRESHPDRYKAHCAVNNAVRDERIIRPDRCSVCGSGCIPHAHHWSYEERNWLDVVWVCVNCHIDIHTESSNQK